MYIPQQALTVIVPIIPERLENLRSLLDKINGQTLRQIKDRSVDEEIILPFEELKTIHFCRFFIIDELKDTEGRLFSPMLAFTTNYDGTLGAHLKEFSDVAAKGFDRVYAHCQGYPTKPKDSSRTKFFKKNNSTPPLFWSAMRGYSVENIKKEDFLRNELQKYLDVHMKTENWAEFSSEEARGKIVQFIKNREDLRWALEPMPKPSLWAKFKYWGRLSIILLFALAVALSAFIITPLWAFEVIDTIPLSIKIAAIVSWLLLIGLGAWIVIGRIYEKADDQIRAITPPPDKKQLERIEERYYQMANMEDTFVQNQLTVYGTIKKPYWFKRTTLKMALKLFALNGAYRSTKGKLSGIPTIHFARWLVFNNNQNVAFLSNYNGNWENYLSEFIERSAGAMNLTFGQMVGYPQVKWFIKGGAHDEQKFKKVVRENQYPSQVFYSAYPTITVRNILNNAHFRKGLHEQPKDSEELSEWLSMVY